MKEKVENILNNELVKLDLFISDVIYEKVGSEYYLKIELDSTKIIDVVLITEASNVINKLIDESNIITNSYILDIYSKEKGVSNEQ